MLDAEFLIKRTWIGVALALAIFMFGWMAYQNVDIRALPLQSHHADTYSPKPSMVLAVVSEDPSERQLLAEQIRQTVAKVSNMLIVKHFTHATYHEEEVSAVGIYMNSRSSKLFLSQTIKKRLAPFLDDTKDVYAKVVFDQADDITESMVTLAQHLALTLVLIIIVSMFVLGKYRVALLPVIIVPIVLMGSLGWLRVTGYSIDRFSMIAIIVILSLTFRDGLLCIYHLYTGKQRTKRSVIDLAGDTMKWIMAGALMTVALLVPDLISGSYHHLIEQQSLYVIVLGGVLMSALMSVCLLPSVSRYFIRPTEKPTHFEEKIENLGNRWCIRYKKVLTYLLRHHEITYMLYGVMILAALLGTPDVVFDHIPREDSGAMYISMHTGDDTQLKAMTDGITTLTKIISEARHVQDSIIVTTHQFDQSLVDPDASAFAVMDLAHWKQRHQTHYDVYQQLLPELKRLQPLHVSVFQFEQDHWHDDVPVLHTGWSGLILKLMLLVVTGLMIGCGIFRSVLKACVWLSPLPVAWAPAMFTVHFSDNSVNIFSLFGISVVSALVLHQSYLLMRAFRDMPDVNVTTVAKRAVLKFKPIMLLAISLTTTLLPLCLSEGPVSHAAQSVGRVLVGGYSIGTIYTLFIVPTLYLGMSLRNGS